MEGKISAAAPWSAGRPGSRQRCRNLGSPAAPEPVAPVGPGRAAVAHTQAPALPSSGFLSPLPSSPSATKERNMR